MADILSAILEVWEVGFWFVEIRIFGPFLVLDLTFGHILGFNASAFTNLQGGLVLWDLDNVPTGFRIYGDIGYSGKCNSPQAVLYQGIRL